MKVRELFETSNPVTLNIADKPLGLGGVVRSVNTDAFVKAKGMTGWTETIKYPENMKHASFKPAITQESLKLRLDQMKIIQSKLVICNMGAIGDGVFAMEDIPANIWLANYSGLEVNKNACSFSGRYAFRVGNENEGMSIIDAGEWGGISRFFQHAPYTLTNYNFEKNVNLNEIAIGNLTPVFTSFNNVKFVMFRTNRLIKKGEPLCYNYNSYADDTDSSQALKDYWGALGIWPLLFKKDGSILSQDSYFYEKVNLSIRLPGAWWVRSDVSMTAVVNNLEEGLPYPTWVGSLDHPVQCVQSGKDEFGMRCYISNEDFKKVWSCNKQSPILFFSKPNLMLGKSDPNPVQMKRTPENVARELKRISGALCLGGWKCLADCKRAFIETTADKDEDLKLLSEYLKANGLNVAYGKNGNTKLPLMHFLDIPSLERLAEIEPYSPQDKMKPSSNAII